MEVTSGKHNRIWRCNIKQLYFFFLSPFILQVSSIKCDTVAKCLWFLHLSQHYIIQHPLLMTTVRNQHSHWNVEVRLKKKKNQLAYFLLKKSENCFSWFKIWVKSHLLCAASPTSQSYLCAFWTYCPSHHHHNSYTCNLNTLAAI